MEDWRKHAACKGADASLFYPNVEEDVADGIKVCNTCPVIKACLEYATTNKEKDGTWGGLSQWERRRIKRRASAQLTKQRKAALLEEQRAQEEENCRTSHVKLQERRSSPTTTKDTGPLSMAVGKQSMEPREEII